MKNVRNQINMMSINQMCIYHYLLEAHNIMRYESSGQIKLKWSDENEKKYLLRNKTKNDLRVPDKPLAKCSRFSYTGAKLYNILPSNIKNTFNSDTFKSLTKKWIWENIPSY